MDTDFDVIVIGAGAGGCCAAARLAHAGYKTLLVEALGHIGGRASTRNIDGFLVNTGALCMEPGGMVEQTLQEVGKPLNLFRANPETVVLVGDKTINVSNGLPFLAREAALKTFAGLATLLPVLKPKKGQMVCDWLNKFSKNAGFHAFMNKVCGSMFAGSTKDVPADAFYHYLTKGSMFKKLGFPVGGTIEVWKPMADVVIETGGAVWLNSSVKRLTCGPDGRINGAVIEKDGREISVRAHIAVSNTGPLMTNELVGAKNLPEPYVQSVKDETASGALITVNFASKMPLAKFPGMAFFTKSRRAVYAANLSDPAQKRAPDGWHLYAVASLPEPAIGAFDLEHEKRLLVEDVKEHFPGFREDMILSFEVTAHDWPAQRAIMGRDLPTDTPIDNLWNVGDGVKPWGDAGTVACAQSARIVVEAIQEKFPPQSLTAAKA